MSQNQGRVTSTNTQTHTQTQIHTDTKCLAVILFNVNFRSARIAFSKLLVSFFMTRLISSLYFLQLFFFFVVFFIFAVVVFGCPQLLITSTALNRAANQQHCLAYFFALNFYLLYIFSYILFCSQWVVGCGLWTVHCVDCVGCEISQSCLHACDEFVNMWEMQ